MKFCKKISLWIVLLFCILFAKNNYAQEHAWQSVEIGAKDERYKQIHFLEDFGWIITSEELWVTENGGKNWSLVFTLLKSEADPDKIITAKFLDSQFGWVVTGNHGEWNDLFQTTDGGINWQRVDYQVETTHPKRPPSLKNLHFFNAQEGLGFFIFLGAVTQEGSMVARTKDGGKTWKQIWVTTGESYIDCLEFSDFSSWFLYDASGFFLHSSDQGKSVRVISNWQGIRYFDFVSSEQGLGLSVEGRYPDSFYVLNLTHDAGTNWIPVQKISQNLIPGTDGFVMDLLFPSLQEGWILWLGTTPIGKRDSGRPEFLILLHVEEEGRRISKIQLPVHPVVEGLSFAATEHVNFLALNTLRRELWVIADGFEKRLLKIKISHLTSISSQGKFVSTTWEAIKRNH